MEKEGWERRVKMQPMKVFIAELMRRKIPQETENAENTGNG